MSDDAPVLHTRVLRIERGARVLCRGLDLEIRAGQCWGLLGRNGAGKTTLLHTLAGLCPPDAGGVFLAGEDLAGQNRRRVARRLGLLLQDQDTRFPTLVIDTVLNGRYAHLGPWRWPDQHDHAIAHQALENVGLAQLAQRDVRTLSGGERQRAAIAAILAQAPRTLLLDEPVTHLDLREQIRTLELIRGLARDGHAVLMSLHDLNLALTYCDHLLLLHRGRALHGTVQRLGQRSLLAKVFGQSLCTVDGPHGRLMVPVPDRPVQTARQNR